ncbi:unnamed protein product [Heligmosomoides polygyrus]|uniref:Uncharacterized protein n=1 Tax=Heligmosomoides polygyrus TaxID=6339 RepID=A0A3P8B2R0_HELPZ|nr:unnamed protein product [Heligmosomoides polygyrus]
MPVTDAEYEVAVKYLSYIAVKLQRAQDAIHRHVTSGNECSAHQVAHAPKSSCCAHTQRPGIQHDFKPPLPPLPPPPPPPPPPPLPLPPPPPPPPRNPAFPLNPVQQFRMPWPMLPSLPQITQHHIMPNMPPPPAPKMRRMEHPKPGDSLVVASRLSRPFLAKQRVTIFSKGSFDLAIKFVVPRDIGPRSLVTRTLAKMLLKCGSPNFSIKRISPIPRAEYEEQAFEYWYQAVVVPEPDSVQDSAVVIFVRKLSNFLAGGFHYQILAEFPGIRHIFTEIRPQHNNVTVVNLAVGNMPNPGLFFVRGDYVTGYNEISNSFFMNCTQRQGERNTSKKNDFTSQLKVAGI